jgi:non-homologous end joining protein Ku
MHATAPMRKLIGFDDETADKLTQLARDRMATWQELADEAFADLLKKHGVPMDLRDALRKSVGVSKTPTKSARGPRPAATAARKRRHARPEKRPV